MPDGITPAAFAAVYVDNKIDAWVREEAPLTFADADGKFTLVNQPSGLLPIFARLDQLTAQLPPETDPTLLHYLRKKSYEKARLFLQGRDSENKMGSCGHV
jgi:hypothetical protein